MAFSIPLLETISYIRPSFPATSLFLQIQQYIHSRRAPFFIGHLRAHTNLPGPLATGNHLADLATRSFVALTLQVDPLQEATTAHALHHLNAQTLRLMFKITREQARQIVRQCPSCVSLLLVPHLGVNPRGLVPNAIWQMDVTHIPSFGQLKYVHVTIDTFSGFICASAQTGEASKNVIAHVLHCLSVLGKPQLIKRQWSRVHWKKV